MPDKQQTHKEAVTSVTENTKQARPKVFELQPYVVNTVKEIWLVLNLSRVFRNPWTWTVPAETSVRLNLS